MDHKNIIKKVIYNWIGLKKNMYILSAPKSDQIKFRIYSAKQIRLIGFSMQFTLLIPVSNAFSYIKSE